MSNNIDLKSKSSFDVNIGAGTTFNVALDDPRAIQPGDISIDKIEEFEINLSPTQTLDIELTQTPSETPGGTKNYNELVNKPKIEGVTLEGNKTFEELHMNALTNIELERLLS